MMSLKYALGALVAVGTIASAQSSHETRGYVRRDGTYVAPHRQSDPNSTKLDNWSTKGNANPYTGKPGTVDPYRRSSTNPYGSPDNSGRENSSGGY